MEKILVISTMYPSKRHPSFGIFVKNQVKALENRGFQVDIAAIRDPRTALPVLFIKYAVWIVQILLILLLKGRQYDIVHAHYVYPSGKLALTFKKLFNTSVIITAHGGDLDKMAAKGHFFFQQTKQVLQKADQIIAVGEELKSDMINRFNADRDKITVLNMGVDRHVFRPLTDARNFIGLSHEATIILYVGNIIKAKGLSELIGAYQDLKKTHPGLELHLIGARKEPSFAQHVQSAASQDKGIHLHPPLGQQAIATWMSAADVFVLPSYMEGFGLVALEAMSCHTPVVGSDVGGLSYLLRDGAGVLIEPGSRRSLTQGIEKVLTNKELQKELIANGEEKARINNQENLIGELIDRYHRK